MELIDPEESDDPLVMQGFKYMQLTPKLVPQYAGDRISCNNCHFNGGNTQGGSSGGISLVGVVDEYPRQLATGKTMSLAERISLCFERSLNGKPVPADDPVMKAIIAYLEWISEPVKGQKKPWLGLEPLKSNHVPDAKQGAIQYKLHCAICHKMDGGGSVEERGDSVPPVFGPHAFNDGAGMAKLQTFASFIYHNMPQGQPYLTEEQALDIAAFVIKQDRPHFRSN